MDGAEVAKVRSVPATIAPMVVLVTLLAAVVALLGLLVAGLLRSHAEILRVLHSMGADLDPDAADASTPDASARVPVRTSRRTGVVGDAGSPAAGDADRQAADIVGSTPRGDARSIAVVGVAHNTLVAFLTSGCSTCSAFWEAFARGTPQVPGDARLVVVTQGAALESPSRLARFAPQEIPVVMSDEAWSAYDVPGAPYFAFIDGPSGQVVGEGAGMTWNQVLSLIEQALDDVGYHGDRRRPRRRRPSGADRADRALLSAGITPGHPSLYGIDAAAPAPATGASTADGATG